jgi:hypothetical protein
MKSFFIKLLYFIIPILLVISIFIISDVFKIFGFQDYYNNDQVIGLNREMISTRTFTHFNKQLKYNSFIFGSSKSTAFKTHTWKQYLPNDARCFHFDANAESLYGINAKLKFIDQHSNRIKNTLIILDKRIMLSTDISLEHFRIPIPEMSGRSNFEFYTLYFKNFIDPIFIYSLIYYSITEQYKTWMEAYILPKSKIKNTSTPITGDFYYTPNDNEIKLDSNHYYQSKINAGVFDRKLNSKTKISNEQYEKVSELLNSIYFYLQKHKSNYTIIISPDFNQKVIDPTLKHLLIEKFGKNSVFDFSGKNEFTSNISNYYENIHYRPILADKLLEIVYKAK